jgi:hypothetical protein
MKSTIPIVIAFLILVLACGAGCVSSPGNTTVPATAPKTVATTLPTTTPVGIPTPDNSLLPAPTQLPPGNLDVTVDVAKDAVFAMITATFRGGLGQYLVDSMWVRVTLSDGKVVEGTLGDAVGDTFTTQGTKRSDRVEVFVRYDDGSVYKIYDELVPFQNINPT